MVGFKASLFVAAAAAVGMVAADSPGFSLHPIDATTGIAVAGGLVVLEAAAAAGLEDCVTYCADRDNCIGFMFDEDFNVEGGFCAALAYSAAGFNAIEPGYEWIGWRYDAPTGPSCSSESDSIPDESGACVCGDDARVQDTPFGCRAAVLASQAARRRSARSVIMPGRHRSVAF